MRRNKFQKEKTSFGRAEACHHHPPSSWKNAAAEVSTESFHKNVCSGHSSEMPTQISNTATSWRRIQPRLPFSLDLDNQGQKLISNFNELHVRKQPSDRGLSINTFPWWQALGCHHITHEQGFFYVVCSFSSPLVLLERMPVACCHLDFLYPIIIHWIHSSLLWSTQHSSCRQTKHIYIYIFFFFFWAITTVLGSGDKPVSKYILSILCILFALSTNNVKIELKLAWNNKCLLPP